MSRLDEALHAIRVAGYHGDNQAWTRLMIENRISRVSAANYFRVGKQQREAGSHCGCKKCQAAFHTHISKAEHKHNASCTTEYNAETNRTTWLVAGRIVGTTLGRVGDETGRIKGYAIIK